MLKAQIGKLHYQLTKVKDKIKDIVFKNQLSKVSDEQVARLDPMSIPKFINQLPKPPVYKPYVVKNRECDAVSTECKSEKRRRRKTKSHLYVIDISEFKQQILPKGLPETTVWGYGGLIEDPKNKRGKYSRSAPGATFEAERGVPVLVKWMNRLSREHMFAVDPTLHWANPNDMPMEPDKPWPPFPHGFPEAQSPVPVVTHLHGGEVPSVFDGHPDAWFAQNGMIGPAFETVFYRYPNKQEPTTLWYHDHTLGITRLNVYAGLAGFYLLRDSKCCEQEECNEWKRHLPHGEYEIPVVIQDRSFYENGSFAFTNVGNNPDIHPYWDPEFFGDTIMVNGKVWPNLDIERRQYRFRLLNGSNARFYNLKLDNGMKMVQIGSDGGFLPKPVELYSLLIAPGERADILIDFSEVVPGTSILMQNDANAPYPDGDPPDAGTVGQIMRFTVPLKTLEPVKPHRLPCRLNDIPRLEPNAPQRILTLNEVSLPDGPITILLNGHKWSAPITEDPLVGSTEEWVIANLTMDTHPIHLHLVQFQLYNRQHFRADEYNAEWINLNGTPPLDHPTIVLPVEDFLEGEPMLPDENEMGWKDTVRMNPHQVTRIRVRFAPQDVPSCRVKPGENLYPFNPSNGPGYVWHCHILDHEDNEMMRPYTVVTEDLQEDTPQ